MKPRQPAAAVGQVRIIGGKWRNTKLPVPLSPGLRPSSDRVRETLFNWLMPRLGGARVLDLFAGSGALGLEAVSRGAAQATLVESCNAASHWRRPPPLPVWSARRSPADSPGAHLLRAALAANTGPDSP